VLEATEALADPSARRNTIAAAMILKSDAFRRAEC
jgi:hypothetical protein